MLLRAPKMYFFILGFQRLVWWPKWAPASRSSFIWMAAMLASLSSGEGAAGGMKGGRLDPAARIARPSNGLGDGPGKQKGDPRIPLPAVSYTHLTLPTKR